MPVISQFFGIIIRMFFNDHAPPHFHAEYKAFKAVVRFETLEVVEGRLPPACVPSCWTGPRNIGQN